MAFVSRMVEESLVLGKQKIRCVAFLSLRPPAAADVVPGRWFTSLLGKYSSISPLVDLLKSKKASPRPLPSFRSRS